MTEKKADTARVKLIVQRPFKLLLPDETGNPVMKDIPAGIVDVSAKEAAHWQVQAHSEPYTDEAAARMTVEVGADVLGKVEALTKENEALKGQLANAADAISQANGERDVIRDQLDKAKRDVTQGAHLLDDADKEIKALKEENDALKKAAAAAAKKADKAEKDKG